MFQFGARATASRLSRDPPSRSALRTTVRRHESTPLAVRFQMSYLGHVLPPHGSHNIDKKSASSQDFRASESIPAICIHSPSV